jgi:hypothetical protein
MNQFGPFVQYPYTETTVWDSHKSPSIKRHIIKHHVHASADDVLITDGTGMTGVVNKFQRILGLKSENLKFHHDSSRKETNCLYFHMEHHSNQTSGWKLLLMLSSFFRRWFVQYRKS